MPVWKSLLVILTLFGLSWIGIVIGWLSWIKIDTMASPAEPGRGACDFADPCRRRDDPGCWRDGDTGGVASCSRHRGRVVAGVITYLLDNLSSAPHASLCQAQSDCDALCRFESQYF